MTYHFESPDPSYPDLDFALHTFHIVKLNTLPPAPAGRLSPKEQQLLGHTDHIVVRHVTLDVRSKTCEGQTADDGLVRLSCAVAPSIIVVKSSAVC